MWIGRNLAVSGEVLEWLLLEHAVVVKIVKDGRLEDEVTDIDSAFELGLLIELAHRTIFGEVELSEPTQRLNRGHCRNLAV